MQRFTATGTADASIYFIILFSHRAAAYIKLEDYQNALTDCKKAIEIDPEYARAHGRMG